MATSKNTDKDNEKDAPKSPKSVSKETSKSTAKDAPKVVTPEAPEAKGDTKDVVKAASQDAPRATTQDAPAGVPMGAVNEADPTATENRFSGVYPNNTYPLVDGALDEVQERRKQARDEGARTRRVSSDAPRDPHPPLTEKFTTNDHAARRAEAETEDVVA